MIKPLKDNILVKPTVAATQSAGGIFIPESAERKPVEGEVMAIGDDQSITLNRGDRVIYGGFSGTRVKIGERELIMMRADDVLARVVDGDIFPENDNVLVELDDDEKKTDTGIVMVAAQNEFGSGFLTGIVRAAGSGGWGYDGPSIVADESKRGGKVYHDVGVEVGERVLFSADRGQPLSLIGKGEVAFAPEEGRHDRFRIVTNNEIEMVVG